MAGLNKILIIGNLGKDPEIKYTASGMAIASFSVAVTEKVKGEDRTEWFKCIAFDKLAGVIEKYLAKGSQVYVEGKIQTREWTDKEGVKRYSTEVVVNQMIMLGSKGERKEPDKQERKPETTPRGKTHDEYGGPPIGGDDIPF